MNMSSVIRPDHSNSFRSGHTLEVTSYVVLAVLLIQHTLSLETTLGTVDAVLALLGAAFGLMASCLLTPISALAGLSGREAPTADVFNLQQPPKATHDDSDNQHKAA